ncbi:MAG TPA: DNA gyrase inhibitor YacG [bacterium]
MATAPLRTPTKILCPRCGEVAAWTGNPFRPFCSERCKMIDLGAWASEDYKIPGKPLEPEEAMQALRDSERQAAEKEGEREE